MTKFQNFESHCSEDVPQNCQKGVIAKASFQISSRSSKDARPHEMIMPLSSSSGLPCPPFLSSIPWRVKVRARTPRHDVRYGSRKGTHRQSRECHAPVSARGAVLIHGELYQVTSQSMLLFVQLPALLLRRPGWGRDCRRLDLLWPQPLFAAEAARNMRGAVFTLPGPLRISICAVRVGTEASSPLDSWLWPTGRSGPLILGRLGFVGLLI